MILVTGGTGFIGSHLVEYLLSLGEDVRVLVRDLSRLRWLEPLRHKVDVAVGDVRDRLSVREALKDVNEVYHLAAVFRHGVDPKLVWEVNYVGTKNVVDECLRSDVRLLYVSTVGVLGPANSKPLNEDSPLNPNPNPYARSKAEAEKYVIRKCRSEGLRAVIVRPAFVYGPRGTYGLNLLINLVVKGRLKLLIGDGSNYIHPIHVRDLVKALYLVMRKGGDGEVYIAANEEPVRLKDFMNLIYKYAGVKVRFGLNSLLAKLLLRFRGGIGGASVEETIMLFTKNWFYDIRKLLMLGWRQEVTLEVSVKEVIEWLSSS